MANVAEEIINIKIDMGKPSDYAMQQFYTIMRKYKIKRGTKHKDGGIMMANFEWTMCYTLFMSRVSEYYTFRNMSEIPVDLEHY